MLAVRSTTANTALTALLIPTMPPTLTSNHCPHQPLTRHSTHVPLVCPLQMHPREPEAARADWTQRMHFEDEVEEG